MTGRRLSGLALVAFGVVFLETLLTRLFSTTLWYHFGFLAISLALLGITASGLVVYRRPRLLADDGFDRRLARAALTFAISAVAAVVLHLNLPFVDIAFGSVEFFAMLATHIAGLAVPFFFGGLVVALLMAKHHGEISRLYFVDLVAASAGAPLLVGLLGLRSGPTLVFALAAGASLAAAAFRGLRAARVELGFAALFALLFLINDSIGLLRVRYIKSFDADQVQKLEVPPPAFEEWTPVARTTAFGPVRDRRDPTRLHFKIFNDGAAPTNAFRTAADGSGMEHTLSPASKAFLDLVAGRRVLILGSGGGRDVWAALLRGAGSVDAVELSPATVELMRGPLREFVGDVYGHPRVTAHVGEGRSFVEHSFGGYGAIELTMVDSWIGNAAGAFLFNENHLYTKEAFESYLGKLDRDGVLVVTRYFPFHEALRVASTMIAAMEGMGIEDPPRQIFVVRPANAPRNATVYGFRSPPSRELVVRLSARMRELGGEVLWQPFGEELPPAANRYDFLFRALMRPDAVSRSRQEFLDDFEADVSPTTDDRPFFFFTQRSLLSSDSRMHPARRWALPFVVSVVAILGALAVLTLIFPLLGRAARAEMRLPPSAAVAYFACLGVGFMLVEIPLIQRFVLFLGHPTYAFVVVLSTLLVASGTGSAFSARLAPARHLSAVVAAILLAVLLLAPAIDPLLRALLSLPFAWRLAVAVLVVAPLGLLMGMPFPLGIRSLAAYAERSVPWAWAINGVFSVLSTGAALLLALAFGFRVTLLLGGLVYAGAMFWVRRLEAEGRPAAVATAVP